MNFILVKYKHKHTRSKLVEYYKDNEKRCGLVIGRIRVLYPNSKIHLVTDEQTESGADFVHVIPAIDSNNYAKLHVFGLLDEPAIYLDNDVILIRRFTEEELPDSSPFNLYTRYKEEDRLLLLGKGLGKDYVHYNTGLMWIPKPDKKITEDLLSLREQFDIHNNGWVNDEYPISYYVYKNGLSMIEKESVNRYRCFVSNLSDCQSIHYTGKEYKDLFFEDLKRLTGPPLL